MKNLNEVWVSDARHHVRNITSLATLPGLIQVATYGPMDDTFAEYIIQDTFGDIAEIVAREEVQYSQCAVSGYSLLYINDEQARANGELIVGVIHLWKGRVLLSAFVMHDLSLYILKSKRGVNTGFGSRTIGDITCEFMSDGLHQHIYDLCQRVKPEHGRRTLLHSVGRGRGLREEGVLPDEFFVPAKPLARPRTLAQTVTISYHVPQQAHPQVQQTTSTSTTPSKTEILLGNRIGELELEVLELRCAIATMGKDFNTILNEIKELN